MHIGQDSLLISVVTNNGSNFMKMCGALLRDLDEAAGEGLGPNDWDAVVEHFPKDLHDYERVGWWCIAHTAQLCILDMLNTSQGSVPLSFLELISKVHLISNTVHNSPNI